MVTLMSFLHSLFAFIIILVPLVVFHEFGHYVFARIFGVKAEVFSVGFGPKLWSKQMGETELRLSAIPMGGYVKLLGEDRETKLSPQEAKRSLHKQAPWKRFFIFFGGPLFNFILAIFIFMVILAIGEPQMASVIGRVVRGSAAAQAGFQSGDQVLQIDGKPVKKYEDIMMSLNENPGKTLHFTVVHPHTEGSVDISVQTNSLDGYSIYGESKRIGEIEGIFPIPRATQVGISNPSSVVGKLGVETGDQITDFNQKAVTTWEEILYDYEKIQPGASFEVKFKKTKGEKVLSGMLVKPTTGNTDLGVAFGLFSSELFVEKTVPKSPAEAAGILAGDRLVSVGDQVVQSFFELKDAVQKFGEKEGKIPLSWERDGKIFTKVIVPTATAGRDAVLNKTTQFTVGVVPQLYLAEPVTFIERVWNPFKLVYLGTERMVTFSWRNLISLRKMITGDVSMGAIGGPIMIGKIAGESLTRGLIAFLTNMAIFSVGLGILNILPVPVLDGGHLILLAIESIRRKPLTLRQMEVVQGLGFILILTLMGIAFRNDLARLIYS